MPKLIDQIAERNLTAHLAALARFTRIAPTASHHELAQLRTRAHELLDIYFDSQVRSMDELRRSEGSPPRDP